MHGHTFYVVDLLTFCLELMVLVENFKLVHVICPFKRFIVKCNYYMDQILLVKTQFQWTAEVKNSDHDFHS